MNDRSPMSDQMTSADTPSAISSPALESGATPCDSPDGPTNAKYGQAPAPASHSARPAKAKRSTTKGIYGQSSFLSSKSEDLSSALASKYRALTDSLGSTLFTLTWSTRITPLGFSIPALRASEPRTEGSVCIGWPTPNTPSGGPNTKSTEKHTGGMDLDGAAAAAWPTPTAEDAESSGMRHGRGVADTMTAVASLTAWGTPAARDWKSGDASQETMDKNARPLNELAMLAGWKTPCVPNGGRISGNTSDIGKHQDGTKAQIGLENEAKLSGWTTPQAHDETGRSKGQKEIHGTMHGCACLVSEARLSGWQTPKVASGDYQYSGGDHDKVALNLSGEAKLAAQSTDSGETPIGYLLGPDGWEIVPALGQLNAGHSRWLMGLPADWDQAGIAASRSLKKRKRG